MNSRRLRILVISYECSPAKSHTAGSAWQILSRLTKWHDLWSITESTQYQSEIEDELAKRPDLSRHLQFTFIARDQSRVPKRRRPVLPIREVLAYKRWHQQAYSVAQSLHETSRFDLVHLLRGDSFREPGYCWNLPIPFVWGPTGGRTIVPWRLLRGMGLRGGTLQMLRSVITAAQFRFSPRVRAASSKASCIIAQTSFDQRKFREVHGVDAVLAHEQAADPSLYTPRTYDGSGPLNVAWIGQCIARKGFPLLLQAMKESPLRGQIVLHVAGDGPYRRKWEAQAAGAGLADCCKWHGWLSQPDTLEVMRKCQVLAFTSTLEATATTVMQALSTGLPVICLKHCGYGDVVDETCGIPIDVGTMRTVIDGFSTALIRLIREPDRVERLSRGAREKARLYSWDGLAAVIHRAYEDVAQRTDSGLVQSAVRSDEEVGA